MILSGSKQINIVTTHSCNLNCDYCSFTNKDQNNNYIDVNTVSRFLNFIYKYYEGAERLQFTLTGGEPLLNKLILRKIIKNIKLCSKYFKKDTVISVPTNGFFVNKDILEFFKQNKVTTLISHDGLLNKANSHRGSKSSISPDNLNLFLKYNDIINIRTVVFPDKVDLMYENFSNFKEIGFSKVDIYPVMGYQWLDEKIDSFLENYEKILKYHIKNKEQFSGSKEYEDITCPKFNQGGMLLDTDGTFYPCSFYMSLPGDLRKKYNIGNVNQGFNISDEFENKVNDFRVCQSSDLVKGMVKKDKCDDCHTSKSCCKICLGYSLKENEYDKDVLLSNWQLMKGIGAIEKKYKGQYIHFKLPNI